MLADFAYVRRAATGTHATLTLHVSAYGFESLEAEFWMASARMAYAIRE
jgi:hypothetical protein